MEDRKHEHDELLLEDYLTLLDRASLLADNKDVQDLLRSERTLFRLIAAEYNEGHPISDSRLKEVLVKVESQAIDSRKLKMSNIVALISIVTLNVLVITTVILHTISGKDSPVNDLVLGSYLGLFGSMISFYFGGKQNNSGSS